MDFLFYLTGLQTFSQKLDSTDIHSLATVVVDYRGTRIHTHTHAHAYTRMHICTQHRHRHTHTPRTHTLMQGTTTHPRNTKTQGTLCLLQGTAWSPRALTTLQPLARNSPHNTILRSDPMESGKLSPPSNRQEKYPPTRIYKTPAGSTHTPTLNLPTSQ